MSDLISRQALCEYALNQKDKSVSPNDIMRFPSAELATNLQPCNQDDLISKQEVINNVRKIILGFFSDEDGVMTDTEKTLLGVNKAICNELAKLPPAQPEITEDDVKEYCRKRCLIVVTSDFYDEMMSRWSPAQPEMLACGEGVLNAQPVDKDTNVPVNDLISRQAVLDTIVSYREDMLHHFEMCYGAEKNRVDDCISLIKNLSPSPSRPPWIPCSERLPDELAEVNITWINTNPAPYYEFIKGKPNTGSAVYYKGRWYWYSAVCADYLAEYGFSPNDDMDDAIKVIAWMPLPEPYAERKTDD